MNFVFTSVKNWLSMLVGIFFWILCSVSLICFYPSANTTYSLLLELYNEFWNLVDFYLLLYIFFKITNYIYFFVFVQKNTCGDCESNCAKSICQFGENQQVYYIEFFNPWTQYVSPFIYIVDVLHPLYGVCSIRVLYKVCLIYI